MLITSDRVEQKHITLSLLEMLGGNSEAVYRWVR